VYGTETLLERIEKYVEINLPVTKENKARGKLTGHPFQRKCFVCRKYLKADDKVCYRDTSYWCKHCQIPLCNKDRQQPELGRELTCEGEHISPSSHVIGCSVKAERGFHRVVPEEEQVNIYPRRRRRSAAKAPASKRHKTSAPPAPAPAPATPRRSARAVLEPEVQQQITSPASVLRSLAESTHAIVTLPRPANRALSISVKKRHLSPRLGLNRMAKR
jgi:hypothetical protein